MSQQKTTSRKPVAVLISDIHYNLKNLELADKAVRLAIGAASQFHIPLIIAGDLHDTKANLRGECVKVMMDTFALAADVCDVRVLIGNHDRINEAAPEHSLEFLANIVSVVEQPGSDFGFYYIPYQHDAAEFKKALAAVPKYQTVICHQGVIGAYMGEYIQDKSAIEKEFFADYRVISGHYHRAQNIKCGPPRKGAIGLLSYIGSPYTQSFSEANDGPKGFRVLYDDGLLEFVPTNLRKHVIIDAVYDGALSRQPAPEDSGHTKNPPENPGDLIWVKVKGPKLKLDLLSKNDIRIALSLDNTNFKLDKLPFEENKPVSKTEGKSSNEIMDLLIDESQEAPGDKEALKKLYKELMS